MNWDALRLSLWLAVATVLVLVPLALGVARWLAFHRFAAKPWVEALLATPLVLPPTVVGYYLLVAFGQQSALGRWFAEWLGQPLVFSFAGLWLASVLVNVPFAVQPMQRVFEHLSRDLRDTAACCGMSAWQAFWRIELPLVWPGVLTAVVLTFAHTLGEFGVVLMVGGNIEGETKTLAVAIYDEVQAFNFEAAGQMAVLLLIFSGVVLGAVSGWGRRLAGGRAHEQA